MASKSYEKVTLSANKKVVSKTTFTNSRGLQRSSEKKITGSVLMKSAKKTPIVAQSAQAPRIMKSPQKERNIPSNVVPKRMKSPVKQQRAESPNYNASPDFNRALAREMYIDSTVHMVAANGKGKNSPMKVKPGQMNLFHPGG